MVRVAPAAVREVVYQIKSLGSLEAEDMVQVTAEVEGAVTEVRFHEGDVVTPQTLLARIDPDRYRLALQRAKAAPDQAIAALGLAQADLLRPDERARHPPVAPDARS